MSFFIRFLILVSFVAFDFSFEECLLGQENDELQAFLQKSVDGAVAAENIPGMSVAVLIDGKLTFHMVAGLRNVNQPGNMLTTEDTMHLGSCTKSMTATMIAVLVKEGAIDWNDTITDRLPELKEHIDPAYHDVTLWQLLTHRGGIKPNGPMWTGMGKDTIENKIVIAIEAMKEKPPEITVGNFLYSNMGYVVAGMMAEKATGKSWQTLINEKLFEPLMMESAGFGVPCKNKVAQQPWGHFENPETKKLTPVSMDNPLTAAAAGGVHCSAGDWAKFIALHLDVECESHDLLTKELLARLHTPYDKDSVDPYGAGWVIRNSGNELWHNGSNTFWFCETTLLLKENVAILIATNSPLAVAEPVAEKVMRAIIKVVTDK